MFDSFMSAPFKKQLGFVVDTRLQMTNTQIVSPKRAGTNHDPHHPLPEAAQRGKALGAFLRAATHAIGRVAIGADANESASLAACGQQTRLWGMCVHALQSIFFASRSLCERFRIVRMVSERV